MRRIPQHEIIPRLNASHRKPTGEKRRHSHANLEPYSQTLVRATLNPTPKMSPTILNPIPRTGRKKIFRKVTDQKKLSKKVRTAQGKPKSRKAKKPGKAPRKSRTNEKPKREKTKKPQSHVRARKTEKTKSQKAKKPGTPLRKQKKIFLSLKKRFF